MRPDKLDVITVLDLKRLLIELVDKGQDTCIRYRLIGEMWSKNFRRVILVVEDTVIFNDEIDNRIYRLEDLSMIMQFELDKPFQQYRPYYHYGVEVNALGS